MGVRFVVRSRGGEKVPGEPEFPFDQSRIVIGRGGASDIRIPDRSVSEHHAAVQARDDHFVIFDMGSTNGTRLDGQRLTPDVPKRLRDGDRLAIGIYELSFHGGVFIMDTASADRTAELARRMLRDAEHAKGKQLAAPRLCVLSGPRTGATLELPAAPARLLIGSGDSSQLVLPDAAIAAEHCEVVCDVEGVLCRSLLGKPPFSIGEHVLLSRRLRDGDELTIGSTHLLFEEPAQALLDALKADPDEPLPAPIAPQPEKTEVLEGAARPSQPSAAAKIAHSQKSPRSDADMLIYALAAVVLIASALGLIFLLRAH